MKKNTIIILIIAVMVGGLGFFGGMQYQKKQRLSNMIGQFQNNQNGTGNRSNGSSVRNRMGQGGGMISGDISSMDNGSLTIKTQDDSSKIVVYSDSTTINKTSQGSASDLKVGEKVMIIGTSGTDGTVTAKTISVGGNFPQGEAPKNSTQGN